MKSKGYQKHMEKKAMLSGKRIVGIDPTKEKHQATVLNEERIQQGKSFSFPVSHVPIPGTPYLFSPPEFKNRL